MAINFCIYDYCPNGAGDLISFNYCFLPFYFYLFTFKVMLPLLYFEL
jgi:hypothetical protein